MMMNVSMSYVFLLLYTDPHWKLFSLETKNIFQISCICIEDVMLGLIWVIARYELTVDYSFTTTIALKTKTSLFSKY